MAKDNQRGEMMEKTTAKTEEEVAGRSLLDLVFSWSIRIDIRLIGSNWKMQLIDFYFLAFDICGTKLLTNR
ncbi:hypothetical protein NC652_038848 [Populus alba x Populus x berolinensis]|nr:hypothetical protein NC652_038848 [Populus alba x Populus x berolinensis]